MEQRQQHGFVLGHQGKPIYLSHLYLSVPEVGATRAIQEAPDPMKGVSAAFPSHAILIQGRK